MRVRPGGAAVKAVLAHTGAVLATHVFAVAGAAAVRGLIGRDGMNPGEGTYFAPAPFGAIHSIGMRFPFDALYLDRSGRVRRVLRGVRPGRLCAWDMGTVAVLELPASAAAKVCIGDVVLFLHEERSEAIRAV